MGTLNAILLFAEHYITWLNATFSWAASKWALQPGPASRQTVSSLSPAVAVIPASRGDFNPQVPR